MHLRTSIAWENLLECKSSDELKEARIDDMLEFWESWRRKVLSAKETSPLMRDPFLSNVLRFFNVESPFDLPEAEDLRKENILETFIESINSHSISPELAKKNLLASLEKLTLYEAQELVKKDPFFMNVKNLVLDELIKEKDRNVQLGFTSRTEVLNRTISDINKIITRAEKEVTKSGIITDAYRNHCKQAMINTITDNLIHNSRINLHRKWGTKLGKAFLNILACIPPILFYTLYKEYKEKSIIHSLSTQARQNSDRILKACKNLNTTGRKKGP